MTSTHELPKAANDLITTATAAGWGHVTNWGVDTGENAYVSVEVARREPLYHVRITWHSRATGGRTLRLFSKIWRHVPVEGRGHDWQDAPSLTKIRESIAGNPVKE